MRPVDAYVDSLRAEIRAVGAAMPDGIHMARLHIGGGTPTVLPPDTMSRLLGAVFDTFATTGDFEFSVEIDPTEAQSAVLDVLIGAGMNRASLGVQDFSPMVQAAIGRAQTRDQTRDVLAYLRSKGVNALNLSALYGLPLQTLQSFRDTLEQVVDMAPDRLAITGYAHVPWMSKRQGAINEADLPIRAKRLEMAAIAQRFLTAQGYVAIGTDHFTKSNDSLHKAAQKGRVGRNFQGYTDDQCDTLIGIGASAISRFQQGYVQNAVATSAYQGRVSQTGLAGYKGYSMSRKDQFVARIIEDLLCGFTLRVDDLRQEFPDQTATIKATSAMLMQRYPDVFYVGNKGLVMQDWAKPLVRIIAQQVDQFSHPEIAHIAAI